MIMCSGTERMNSCWVSGVGLDFYFSHELIVAVVNGIAVVKIRNVC